MTRWYYVEPNDSVFVRGNLDFGEGGEHGTGPMPPPPSLFAGAFRSALLGRDAFQLAAFAVRGRTDDPALHACLGTPDRPGAFRVRGISLAGAVADGRVEPVHPLPADLIYLKNGFARLMPRALPLLVQSAGDLPLRATLQTARQDKPLTRYLTRAGLERHLRGSLPEAGDAVAVAQVHQRDPRLGIELASVSRTAQKGRLYTTDGHAFSPPRGAAEPNRRGRPAGSEAAKPRFSSTGFLVGIDGADGLLPERGQLRLGGDGRGAQYRAVQAADWRPDLKAIGAGRRFRLVLQTPALFTAGWLPNGVTASGADHRLHGDGFEARLACAAAGRREIVSGWDLHRWKPKPAEAAAPAGSVYWFDEFRGDAGKLADWVASGLSNDTCPRPQRRAEGYNLAWLAPWTE